MEQANQYNTFSKRIRRDINRITLVIVAFIFVNLVLNLIISEALILKTSLLLITLFMVIRVPDKVSKRLEKEIIAPVSELVEASAMLSKGQMDVSITYDIPDELGSLAENMRESIAAIKALIKEVNTISHGVAEGDLDSRGDDNKFQGGYREIVQGVNCALESVIGPLKKKVDSCIYPLNRLIEDIGELSYAAAHGELGKRVDISSYGDCFANIINGVNKTVDMLVGYIEALPSPVIILDEHGKIIYINQAGASLTDLTQCELIGTSHCDNFRIGDGNVYSCGGLNAIRQREIVICSTAVHLDEKDSEIFEKFEIAIKQAAYQDREIDRLIDNLERLAEGNLTIGISGRKTDEDTQEMGGGICQNRSMSESLYPDNPGTH